MPTVRVRDADIRYEVTGEGDAILWIMGLAMDSRMWMFQLPAFQGNRNVVLDNRGVGGSSLPPGPYSIRQMAADALAVLDAAQVERTHVVGISMGGAIAQELALQAPDRVRSLVLAATWCAPNPYLARMNDVGDTLIALGGLEAVTKAMLLWLFTPKFILEHNDLLSRIETMMVQFQPPAEAYMNQVAAVRTHDTLDRLGAVKVPTLVIVGRRDILVPPELSEQLAAAIPGSTLRIIEGGHGFNAEEANSFNSEVASFIKAQ